MFNSHLQINVIRSPNDFSSCFSPLSSVLTSYPWTPKTAIAWTSLEENRFFDLSYSYDPVTNPNVARLRLNRADAGAPNGASNGAAAVHVFEAAATEADTDSRYKEAEESLEETTATKMGTSLSTSLVLSDPLPTPDISMEQLDVEETNIDTGEYRHMYSNARLRELYSKSYPNIVLPPINPGENPYAFGREKTPSPSPSPTLPSLTAVLGDLMPVKEDSPSELSESSDSNYSPGSEHSSPGFIYKRGRAAPQRVVYTQPKSESPYSPPDSGNSTSCVAELKNRGLWEEAQKKKRGKLTCSECGKYKHQTSEKYDHLADLARHMDKKHADLSHRLKCPHTDCAWGVIGFVSLTEQKRHIKHLHENKPIECEICLRKLQRQDGFIRHMRDVHGVEIKSKSEKLPRRKTKK